MVKGIDHLPKARQAVAAALEKLAPRLGIAKLTAQVAITNPIPTGKGMGSSSADITAAVGVVGMAAGYPFTPESIASIALSVEPTDGVMFPGIALIDHRRGSIAESLGPPPPLEVIVIDTGGTVDTLEFNRTDRTALWEKVASRTDEALELVREGIRRGAPELVGRGATISARAGNPPELAEWVERAAVFADEQNAAGINVAHSGTVVGILLLAGMDARQRRSKPVYRHALAAFADAESVQHFPPYRRRPARIVCLKQLLQGLLRRDGGNRRIGEVANIACNDMLRAGVPGSGNLHGVLKVGHGKG